MYDHRQSAIIYKRSVTPNTATVTIAAEGVRHDNSAMASLQHQSHGIISGNKQKHD